jgi:myo-inositol-1(or 4)-monophosphatase
MTKPTLSDLEELARGAGKILKEGFGKRHQIDLKGEIDLVTEMDREVESYLLNSIRSQFQEHTIISEESGILQGQDGQIWYIDPLDGTVNYAHGVPIYSVAIAYAEDGKIILGMVYDPMQDECFSAERSMGAWLNGIPLQVSRTQDLDSSLLVTGFGYDIRTNPDNNLNHYVHFSLKSRGVRRFGSAAIDLAYVAAGRLDGYWEVSIYPWDIAAGVLFVEEAGGKVTDIHGGIEHLSPTPTLLATNGLIHEEMLVELNR